MKIKSFAIALIALFSCIAFSCGSDETKEKLNGQWTADKEVDADGTTTQFSWSFNSEDGTGSIRSLMENKEWGEGTAITIELPFTWTLTTDKTIHFVPKNDDIKVSYSQAFLDELKAEGSDAGELTAEIKKNVLSGFDSVMEINIESITDTELKVRAKDNSIISLYRR